MDIHQLETFLAVADENGFSRAAQRLHRTQPAVSQVIRKLEGDLGEVLFERSARDGTLTAAGEVLRDYARRMLALRTEAATAMEELKSLDRGRLLIAANEFTCLRCSTAFAAFVPKSASVSSVPSPAGFPKTCCSEPWNSASFPSVPRETCSNRRSYIPINWPLW